MITPRVRSRLFLDFLLDKPVPSFGEGLEVRSGRTETRFIRSAIEGLGANGILEMACGQVIEVTTTPDKP